MPVCVDRSDISCALQAQVLMLHNTQCQHAQTALRACSYLQRDEWPASAAHALTAQAPAMRMHLASSDESGSVGEGGCAKIDVLAMQYHD